MTNPPGKLETLVLVVLLSLLAAIGYGRWHSHLSLDHMLATDSQVFADYQRFAKAFPREARTLLLIVEGDELDIDFIQRLKRLSSDVFADRHVELSLSPLSDLQATNLARQAQAGDTEALTQLRGYLSDSTNLVSSAFSPSSSGQAGEAVLVSVILSAYGSREPAARRQAVATIQDRLHHHFPSPHFTVHMAGAPAALGALEREFWPNLIRSVGGAILLATVIAAVWFRSGFLVMASLLPALVAGLWSQGITLLILPQLTPLSQQSGILALIIAFSSTLHLMHAYRQQLLRASPVMHSSTRALFGALQQVMPAVVVAALTTGAGFAALTFSETTMLREFGLAGCIAVACGFMTNRLFLPALDRLVTRNLVRIPPRRPISVSGRSNLVSLFSGMIRFDRVVVTAFGVLSVTAVLLATQLKPAFQLAENLPKNSDILRAVDVGNSRFGGLTGLHVMQDWSEVSLPLTEKLQAIENLQQVLTATGMPWVSIVDIIDTLPGSGLSPRYRQLPRPIRRLAVSHREQHGIVSTRLAVSHDLSGSTLTSVRNLLSQDMRLEDSKPLIVTGIPILIEKQLSSLVSDLLSGAVLTLCFAGLMIAVWLRSAIIALIAVAVNLLPGLIAASLVALYSGELRFAAIIAFCVGTGIAVDSSVHLLQRYRLLRGAGSPQSASVNAIVELVPVLMVASLILIGGFAVLLLNAIPALSQLGLLVMLLLILALLVDVILLPALLRIFGNRNQ